MRKRSFALLLVVLTLGTSSLAAEPLRDRRDGRDGSFTRIVRTIKKVFFGISSNGDELIIPRPDDPPRP